jgi:hypothetical protein
VIGYAVHLDDIAPGSPDIFHRCEDAHQVATLLGFPVVFDFNGVRCLCVNGGDPAASARQWWEDARARGVVSAKHVTLRPVHLPSTASLIADLRYWAQLLATPPLLREICSCAADRLSETATTPPESP